MDREMCGSLAGLAPRRPTHSLPISIHSQYFEYPDLYSYIAYDLQEILTRSKKIALQVTALQFHQLITNIGYGQDVVWVTGISLDFAAQAADINPDEIYFAVVFCSPHPLQQQLVRHNPARILR